jgi:hypothetical protein
LKISIWKYVKLEARWRYCAAVEESNRYKPDWVHVIMLVNLLWASRLSGVSAWVWASSVIREVE